MVQPLACMCLLLLGCLIGICMCHSVRMPQWCTTCLIPPQLHVMLTAHAACLYWCWCWCWSGAGRITCHTTLAPPSPKHHPHTHTCQLCMQVGVMWHVECGEGIVFPFSRGCSFITLTPDGRKIATVSGGGWCFKQVGSVCGWAVGICDTVRLPMTSFCCGRHSLTHSVAHLPSRGEGPRRGGGGAGNECTHARWPQSIVVHVGIPTSQEGVTFRCLQLSSHHPPI
jgi:hypothetical protein